MVGGSKQKKLDDTTPLHVLNTKFYFFNSRTVTRGTESTQAQEIFNSGETVYFLPIALYCKEPLPAPGNRSNERRYRGKDLATTGEEVGTGEREKAGGEKTRGGEKKTWLDDVS
ncbi:hypothetical protein TNCV_1782751 [Trichonephila clavipes]|nr:hypothetical protein TNCV_1782751 [Trichonephila clavipes]